MESDYKQIDLAMNGAAVIGVCGLKNSLALRMIQAVEQLTAKMTVHKLTVL